MSNLAHAAPRGRSYRGPRPGRIRGSSRRRRRYRL